MRVEREQVSLRSIKLDLLAQCEREIGATRVPEPVHSPRLVLAAAQIVRPMCTVLYAVL